MLVQFYKFIFFVIGVFLTKYVLDHTNTPLKNYITIFDCLLLIILGGIIYLFKYKK